MKFTRNKFTKSLLVVVLILILGLSSILLFQNKFQADSNLGDSQIDEATLASLAVAQKSSIPVVKSNYSKAEIEKAIANYRNTTLIDLKKLSNLDRQIIDEISKNGSGDSGIAIVDKDGRQVSQTVGLQAGIKSKSKVKAVENFDFSVDIPQNTKENLIAAYPKIEEIYGTRSNNNKIKVKIDGQGDCNTWGRSCYRPVENSINFTPGALTSVHTATHELIHAFHGPYCLRPLWEEGMTESASEIILSDYYLVNNGMKNYELENLPYLSFNKTLTAQGDDAYSWGSAIMFKIYLENKDFYKIFNTKLYSTPNYQLDSPLIKIAAEAVPVVEGEKTLDWFSHQYSIVHPDNLNRNFDDEIVAWTFLSEKMNQVEFRVSNTGAYKKLNLKTYYANGTLAGECSGSYADPNFLKIETDYSTINNSYCANINFVPEYKGYLKSVVTTDGEESNKRTSFFIQGETIGSIKGVVNGPATVAKVTNLDSNWSSNFPINNGLFEVPNDDVKPAGKYKVEIFDSERFVKEHYFNKSAVSSYTTFVDLMQLERPEIKFSALSRSISLNVTSDNYAGYIFKLNGIPFSRIWGKSGAYQFTSLNKNTLYAWGIFSAISSNVGKRYGGKIRTLKGTDFILTSAKNFGNVADGTFYRQYNFNKPYDPNSVKLELGMSDNLPGDGIPAQFKIVPGNAKSFKLVPSEKLKNNALYGISGLNEIKDLAGNPIFQYNWDLGNFTTPINPIDAASPAYSVSSGTYGPSDKILITTNFKSRDLVDSLSRIKFFTIYNGPECEDGCARNVKFTVRIIDENVVGSQLQVTAQTLEIVPDQPMLLGSYWITLPIVTDDNNNYVSSQSLNFSVK